MSINSKEQLDFKNHAKKICEYLFKSKNLNGKKVLSEIELSKNSSI